MNLPPYIESGSVIVDAVGHRYKVTHSADCDEWGNPKLWVQDLDPGLDGQDVKTEYSVAQLRKMGYKLKGGER